MKHGHDKVNELRKSLKNKKEAEAKKPKKEMAGDEELIAKLHEIEDESKKNYDRLLRITAEFENYKKRTSKESQELVKYASEGLVNDLLTILDDFDRVEAHLPEKASKEVKAIGDGVAMVHKHLLKVMVAHGLEPVDALGKQFDPLLHEALGQLPSSKPQNTVIEVHRKGYKLLDRLIRPAQVTISKGK